LNSHSLDKVRLGISCSTSEWQLSSLAQVCTSFSPLLFTVKDLYIDCIGFFPLDWPDDIENAQWLELLHPFSAVKDLYPPRRFTPGIAFALQELVEEGVKEVIPALPYLFLEEFGPVQEGIKNLLPTRQLLTHPRMLIWDRM